jgi:hypothetical protein
MDQAAAHPAKEGESSTLPIFESRRAYIYAGISI